MADRKQGIDGFIPRREQSLAGSNRPAVGAPTRPLQSANTPSAAPITTVKKHSTIDAFSKADLDESLKSIDEPQSGKKGKKRKAPQSKKRRIIKWSIIAVLIILLAVGGWLAYRALTASNNIFKGNILGLAQSKPLKEDENGRSNILLLGTSEDDPGHEGAHLTDSMMIMSLHQKNKTVDMFSIPRDLYVQYGRACNSGYEGKINEYFNCVNQDWTKESAEEERLTESRKFIGDIFGMDLQYAVHVNNTVIKEAVEAVDGIKVDIQGSNGDPGILDRNFDWRCNYECYFVKYDNGVHQLNGEQALFLAMARGDIAPTYGLGNSNFDREKNQQKIIIALKEKAVSTGTLTNISKVTKLVDALGANLRTNFDTSEIRTLADFASEVDSKQIKTISLYDQDNPLVRAGDYNGASVVMPVAGIFDYSQIRQFLKKEFSSDPMVREEAKVVVLNGSGQAGAATVEAEKLEKQGFLIQSVDNAPEGTYADVEIYAVGDDKPATKEKLESTLGVTAKTTAPPTTVNGDISFVVVIGKAASAE